MTMRTIFSKINQKTNDMKRLIAILTFILSLQCAQAFETHFMSVDFDKMTLTHDGQVYSLVEVKKKVRRTWKEVTYLCIDEKLHAVAFRLFVTDEGEFMRLQKYTSRK